MEKFRHRSTDLGVGSPVHGNHARSSSASGISNIKRTQNYAAKAAAQRLAQVMASQSAADNEDDEDDDGEEDEDGSLGLRFNPPLPLSLSRPPIKANGINNVNSSVKPVVQSPKISRSSSDAVTRNLLDEIPSVRSTSTGRPSISIGNTHSVPPSRPPLKIPEPIPPIDPPTHRQREKRFSQEFGQINLKDAGDKHTSSALHDELDMLQEENENILEKIELTCKGQQLQPFLTLQHVRDDIWSSPRDLITLVPNSSTTDHIMVLHYARAARGF